MFSGGDAHHDDRDIGGVKFKEEGIVHFIRDVRQDALGQINAVADVIGGLIKVSAPDEFQGNYRSALRRSRGDFFQAGRSAQLVLQLLGNLDLYILGAGAGIIGDHRDNRRFDLRKHIYADAGKAVKRQDDNRGKNHQVGHRLLYPEFRQIHLFLNLYVYRRAFREALLAHGYDQVLRLQALFDLIIGPLAQAESNLF